MDVQERLRHVAVSDSGFLFDPYTGLTFSVNATGRAILERLRAGEGVEDICRALGERFATGQGDDLQRDVREFLLQLREQGILPRDEA
jgi:PqqD family protein of HPr-rel-A system